jgi:hypothetical protein
MNFMKDLPAGKEASNPFNLEQLEIGTGFVDELISFGFLSLVYHWVEIFSTCTLFLVSTSVQPGQW